MNKITIKKIPFKLSGEVIKKGEKLEFIGVRIDNDDFHLKDIQGFKVISTFPNINTSICDFQTKEIHSRVNDNKNVTFISLSMDSPEKQKQWCAVNSIKNMIIVSDQKYGDFSKKTNLLIPKIKKLHRSFIILDKDDTILDILTNKEIGIDPNYAKLDDWLLRLKLK